MEILSILVKVCMEITGADYFGERDKAWIMGSTPIDSPILDVVALEK